MTPPLQTRPRRPGARGFARVRQALSGRWGQVIADLLPEFAAALGPPGPGRKRIPCPVHGSAKGARGDGFRFFGNFAQTGGGVCNTCGSFASGIDLIVWARGSTDHQALRLLEGWLGLRPGAAPPVPRPVMPGPEVPQEDPAQVDRRRRLLRRLWAEALPLDTLPDSHPALHYLVTVRHLGCPGLVRAQPFLRYHPALLYCDGVRTEGPARRLPGLLAQYRDAQNRLRGLQRLYLQPGAARKADVPARTKALRDLAAPLHGGVPLIGPEPRAGHAQLCEGLETGLSILRATGAPVIAATTARLLANWEPPAGTRAVTIWADRDLPGQGAGHGSGVGAGMAHAQILHRRLAARGIAARILLPPPCGAGLSCDWNDVLREIGPEGLRAADRSAGWSPETTGP